MKTVNLLNDLNKRICENPSIIPSLPWNDIYNLALVSLYVRKSIYPQEQYQSLENIVTEHLINAKSFAVSNDVTSLSLCLNTLVNIFKAIPDSEYVGAFIEEANYNKAYIDHIKRQTAVIIGDSHVSFFSGNENLTYSPIGHGINVCPNITGLRTTSLHLGACLAYSANKRDASTEFRSKLDFLINHFINAGATIIFSLGEIDIRAHVFKQATLQNRPFESIVSDILTEYEKLLLDIRSQGFKTCVWGPIASQPDSSPLDSQFPRYGSELERNKCSLLFTERLKNFCSNNGITFVSILEDMLDANGLTNSKMLSNDLVHLNQSVMPLAVKKLEDNGINIH